MIYLDSAATSFRKPPEVREAVLRAMEECASPGRGGYPAANKAAECVFACRERCAALFDCRPEQVVFTANATHGLNLAIKGTLSAGDRVVVSGFEHNAVMRPLYALGARITVAGTRLFDPEDTLRAFRRAVTPGTKAVICTHVSNVFGYVLPIEEIAALCRTRGAALIVDASQSAGCLPVSLQKLGAAYIAMPGHKGLYGPQGTGVLLCGTVPGRTLIEGGTGSLSEEHGMPQFLPDRLEPGTHNVPGIAGLSEGIRFVTKTGLSAIQTHEQRLVRYAAKLLSGLPNVRVFAGEPQSGVLSFLCGADSEETAAYLASCGIAVRAGLHCAPAAHTSAGTLASGTVRASFSVFSTEADVNALADAVSRFEKNSESEKETL